MSDDERMSVEDAALWAADTMKQVMLRYSVTHPDLQPLIDKHVDNYGGLAHMREMTSRVNQHLLDSISAESQERWMSVLRRLESVEADNGGCTEKGKAAVRATLAFMSMTARDLENPHGYTDDDLETLWKPMLDWLKELGDLYERGEYRTVER